MSTVSKLASVAALASLILGSSLGPSYALRMPESADVQIAGQQSVSAYAGNDQTMTASEASVLSPGEMRHIKWCAAKYALNYDAVSDTYVGSHGTTLQCHSPR